MFLTSRFYIVLVLIVLLLGGGYVFAPLFVIGQWALLLFAIILLVDGWMLYHVRGIKAFRKCPVRFSNGDDNAISIRIENSYSYTVSVEVIDEIPLFFRNVM